MASPESYNTIQGRIDSFAAAHHLAKRRASSTKKKGPSTVSWPHSSPLPNDLARAGFFYKPKADTEDNCECYLCHVKLDGWEQGDDPIDEHLKHSPECGWAVSASLQRKFNAGDAVDADPMSEQFVQARTHTFGESWPHESKKGWKPKVAKMVAAGWTYDPSPEYDDGVTCMYCNLSLDGWEPKDDPFAEHQKRCPDCPFFSLVEEWAAARQQTKGRKGKGRTSRASKGSRLSTQSMVSVASEVPSQLSLGDVDGPAADEDSVLTTATNATTTSTTGKGRKKAAAKGTRKGAKGKKAAAVADESVTEVDPAAQIEASVIVEAPAKPTRKASRSKKAAPVEEPSVMDVDPPVAYPTIIDEPPKRQTRRKASKAEQPSQIEDTLAASQTKRPARGKTAKAKQQVRMSEDESQLHSELQAAVDASMMSTQQTARSMRGTKRTSDGAPKIDSSVVILNEEPAEFQSQTAKPKRGRKPKATASQTESQDDPQPRSSDASEVPQRVASVPNVPPKSKKGRKAAKVASPEPEPEPEPEMEPEPEVDMPVETQDEAAALEALEAENDEDAFDFGQSLVNPTNPYAPIMGTPDRGPSEASPAPSSPTPLHARATPGSSRPLPTFPVSSAQKSAQPHRSTTPTSSPNASDAENQPPSSRPASVRPPLTAQRIPLAPALPNKPPLSPSKRTITGGLTSTLPWSPTKLEEVFLNSPVKRNLGLSASPNKENALSLSGTDVEHLDARGLKDVVKKVREAMGDEERNMTVEEWVRWNAKVGEERLRRECEGLVMVFEREGGRALRCLEGVECVP